MLSDTAIAAYRRDGFIVLPGILNPTEIEALRGVTDGSSRARRRRGQ